MTGRKKARHGVQYGGQFPHPVGNHAQVVQLPLHAGGPGGSGRLGRWPGCWILAAPAKAAWSTTRRRVSKGQIRKIVSTSGPVRALVTVSVGSQLSGQVETVKVDFNTEVKPGEVLAVLDDKTFAAKVAQAKADLAAAEAGLANQQAALNKAEIGRAGSRSSTRIASRSLAAKGFSAQSALDTAIRDTRGRQGRYRGCQGADRQRQGNDPAAQGGARSGAHRSRAHRPSALPSKAR